MARLPLITLGAVLTVAVGCAPSPNLQTPRELHRGLSGEPSTLDPALSADTFSHDILEDVYEGLTSESPSGDIIPGVASSWEVDASGQVYTFHLRQSRWSNGEPLRAQAFIDAWQRVLNPKKGSPAADDLRLIIGATSILKGQESVSTLGVEAPDDLTLIVHLVQPAPYFPQLVSHSTMYPVYSEASAGSHGGATWVSNGAYVVSQWAPGTSVTVAKNPTYWNAATVRIPAVRFLVTSDVNAQYTRYRTGDIDLTDNVPENAAATLKQERPSELLTFPILTSAYYAVNLNAAPFAHNEKLRQALSMAVDRQRLVKILAFDQAPAYGLVPPGTDHYTPQVPPWASLPDEARIATAKRLFQESGYAVKTSLHLRLLANASPSIHQIGIVLAAMWQETLGVTVDFETQEYRVFLDSRRDKSRWELARLAWSADFNDASNFLDTLRSDSPNNDSAYANPTYDALLDAAAASTDSIVRRTLLEKAERTLLADTPIIPVYFFVAKRLVNPQLHGVVANPLNHIRSQALYFDETAAH